MPADQILPNSQLTTVLTDTPCRKCQYNLRSLPLDGLCPECATPVALSVKGDLLRYCDPVWLNSLHRGVSLVITALILSFFSYAFLIITIRTFRSVFPNLLVGVFIDLVHVLGGWWFTCPDPSGLGEDQYGRSRRFVRITLWTGFAGQLLTVIRRTATFTPIIRWSIIILSSALSILGVAGLIATFNFVTKLARRIPDDAIAVRSRFLMYAIGIVDALLVTYSIIINQVGQRTLGSNLMPIRMFAGFLGLAMFIFQITYLVLLFKLAHRLREARTFAESTWTATIPS